MDDSTPDRRQRDRALDDRTLDDRTVPDRIRPDREARFGRSGAPAPPVHDDAALLARARAIVQEGLVRRLWILLFGADGTMLCELQQVDGIPVSPDAFAVAGIAGILGIVAPPGIDVALVVERSGPPVASPDDWAWHDAIVGAARARGVVLRGVLLAHGSGVDFMEPGPPQAGG